MLLFFFFFLKEVINLIEREGRHASVKAQEVVDHLASFLSLWCSCSYYIWTIDYRISKSCHVWQFEYSFMQMDSFLLV